jgi:hypothetical protein
VLGNLTLRVKVLIGIALACAGYVVLMPDTAQTIEPRRGGDAAAADAGARGAAGGGSRHMIKPGTDARNPSFLNAFLHRSERIVDNTGAASLFAPQSWYVAPPAPPPPPPSAPLPPPPPTAPPLPFAFMGSYKTEGAGSTYFLTAGDRVYDVKIGDTLDNTYSVDGVKAGQLLLTYMPLKIQQSLAVGDE